MADTAAYLAKYYSLLWTSALKSCRPVVPGPSTVAAILQLCLANLKLLDTYLWHISFWCLVRRCQAGSE